MLQQNSGLTIRDLSSFLKVTPQTIRNKLKDYGLLHLVKKSGRSYYLEMTNAQNFIATTYPLHYNDFVKAFGLIEEGDSSMFPIPTGKGRITAINQASGNRFYYVCDLPLYYDDKGNLKKYRSKGFEIKELAESERRRVIIDRDNGKYKFQYLQDLAIANQQEATPKEAEQSYADFCVDFYDKRKITYGTKKLYMDIIKNRIKPYFGDMPIKDLTKGRLQAFVDEYGTLIPKMFTVLSQTLRK